MHALRVDLLCFGQGLLFSQCFFTQEYKVNGFQQATTGDGGLPCINQIPKAANVRLSFNLVRQNKNVVGHDIILNFIYDSKLSKPESTLNRSSVQQYLDMFLFWQGSMFLT